MLTLALTFCQNFSPVQLLGQVLFCVRVANTAIFKMYLLEYWRGSGAEYWLWIYKYICIVTRCQLAKAAVWCEKWHEAPLCWQFLPYLLTVEQKWLQILRYRSPCVCSNCLFFDISLQLCTASLQSWKKCLVALELMTVSQPRGSNWPNISEYACVIFYVCCTYCIILYCMVMREVQNLISVCGCCRSVRGTSAAEHEASLRKLYSVKTVQVSSLGISCDISLGMLLAWKCAVLGFDY